MRDTAAGASRAPAVESSITLDGLRVEDGQVAVEDRTGFTRDVYKHIDLTVNGVGPNRR